MHDINSVPWNEEMKCQFNGVLAKMECTVFALDKEREVLGILNPPPSFGPATGHLAGHQGTMQNDKNNNGSLAFIL